MATALLEVKSLRGGNLGTDGKFPSFLPKMVA